jgi:hypothetical protein
VAEGLSGEGDAPGLAKQVGSRAHDQCGIRALGRRTLSRLSYVKRGFCICRVIRDPQLGIIDHGRRCSSVKETQSSDHTS